MELKKPKPKKNYTPKGKLILPSESKKEIIGVFNGQFVTVCDWDAMHYLYESGSFGKGTLSRGQPNYHIKRDDIPKIMLQHQFENHVKWCGHSSCSYPQKFLGSVRNDFKLSLHSLTHFLESSFDIEEQETWKSWKEKHKEKSGSIPKGLNLPVVEFKSDEPYYKDEVFSSIVNDILQTGQLRKPKELSMTDEVVVVNTNFTPQKTDSSLTNASACLKKLHFSPHENLNLSLEESFFLKSVLGFLKIVDLNLSEIGIQEMWEKFNAVDKNFAARYITYNYYRSKGWVVKSGLKFGGDYLLYKDGPACYHASYLVKILDRKKKLSWREFIAMNRLVETFNKDLLLCEVLPNETAVDGESYANAVNNSSVQEVLVRRWFPSKERFSQENTSD